jgi:hypothetical protein
MVIQYSRSREQMIRGLKSHKYRRQKVCNLGFSSHRMLLEPFKHPLKGGASMPRYDRL